MPNSSYLSETIHPRDEFWEAVRQYADKNKEQGGVPEKDIIHQVGTPIEESHEQQSNPALAASSINERPAKETASLEQEQEGRRSRMQQQIGQSVSLDQIHCILRKEDSC